MKTPTWPDCSLAIPIISLGYNGHAGQDHVSDRPEIFCKQDSSVSVKGPFIFPVSLYLIVEYLPFSHVRMEANMKCGQQNSCF